MPAAVASSRPPRDHPLLGHWLAWRRDQLEFVNELAAYGDWVPLRFPPLQGVFINHPDLIEEVLVTCNRDFIKSLSLRRTSVLGGNGLLISDGEFWLRQRRLAQPAFHRERINAYAQLMTDLTDQATSTWRDGEVRNIHQEMMRLTFAIVGKALFGADLSDEAAEVGAALTTALELLQERITSFSVLLPDTVPTPTVLRIRRAAKQLDRVVYRIIRERRASDADRADLLSLLLRAHDEDGSRMTDRQLRDEITTLALAGHETTALALTWTWYLLAQHPEVERKLHAELAGLLGGRSPTINDLARLPYTGMVVSEALRLYPPGWSISRESIRDTSIGGRRVPKGAVVIMSQWSVHRDPRWFVDPYVFDPDRWADGLAERLPRFAYFPFSGGQRQCLGNTFALVEANLLLATIAQRFRLVLEPGQDVRPEPALTLRPNGPIRVRVHTRPVKSVTAA